MIDEGKLDLEKLKTVESSERIISELDKIRGIGVWTAEMTMLRGMQKLDAFPADDLGLRSIVSKYYCGHKKITSEDARKIASAWGTWKGLAGYYLVVASILGMEVSAQRSNQDGQK
jgi:DNA-3-methyladenine glycosylase II